MRLLITGGAGFIGSNFIRYYRKNHPDDLIVNFDKLTYAGNPDNLKDIRPGKNYHFVRGDIADRKAGERVIRQFRIEGIINFAAETHVDRSILGDEEFFRTNFYGVKILLETFRRFSLKRFLQISTDEVYGSTASGYFSEESPLQPNSPYAASKAAADLLCRAYFKTYKIPVIISRSSNNFGPYQYPEKAIPLFVTNLLQGKKIPLYGRGANVRDWLYVEDNCRAIDLVFRRGKPGQIYNIGGHNELSNKELVGDILNLMNQDSSMVEMVSDRPGHDFRYALKTEKVRRLGFNPEYAGRKRFLLALKKTIDWYRENTWWWKKIKEKNKKFRNYYQQNYEKR